MEKMTSEEVEKLQSELAGFTGTEQWYRHWTGRLLYTDGVKHLADRAEAYWLIDAIASWQTAEKVKAEGFQVWFLWVHQDDKKGRLTCYRDYDGDLSEPANYTRYGLARQEIEVTDFPLPKMKLYVEGAPEQPVLLLPSEH